MSTVSSLTSSDPSAESVVPSGIKKPAGWRPGAVKPFKKRPQPSVESVEEARFGDAPDLVDTEIEVVGVTKHINPIETATMEDVNVSGNAMINPAKPPNKKKKNIGPVHPKNLTNLVSILGIPACDLHLDDLRKFVAKFRIPKVNHASKKKTCDGIANFKLDPPKKSAKPNSVNRKRYCNVIFSDGVRPDVANRGESLSARDLTDGLKTDELLHRKIVLEYNNPDKYNDDAWPNLRNCRSSSPHQFAGPIDWMQSSKTLKALVKEYEVCFNNWKLSGNHGNFGESRDSRLPFADFIQNNNSLLYLHEFVYQYPNIFEKVTGELPKGVFSEGIAGSGDNERSTGAPVSSSKKKTRSQLNNNNNNGWLQLTNSSATKNAAIEYSTLLDSSNGVTETIQQQRDRKRSLVKAAAESSDCSTNLIKKRFKDYKENKDDPDPHFEDSQESIFEDLLEIEDTISEGRKQKDFILSAMKRISDNKENA